MVGKKNEMKSLVIVLILSAVVRNGARGDSTRLQRINRPKLNSQKTILQTESNHDQAFNALKVANLTVEIKDGGSAECSCFNPKATRYCCRRSLHQAHKMGTMLSQKIVGLYRHNVKRSRRKYKKPPAPELERRDYRDVVVVRNIYEAISSGYLYHRSGHECWIDPNGKKRIAKAYPDMRLWTSQALPPYQPKPPAESRSLCEYMEQESEPVAMHAYMAWVLGREYRGLPGQWEIAQRPTELGRTLFVCYEDLANPDTDEATLDTIANFLFPGSTWKGERTASTDGYSGGHGTSHDVILRLQLRKLVEEVDQMYFGGWVARFDQMFPCGASRAIKA